MRNLLYINDSYCLSLDQLRSFFSMELIPGTPLYEDLLRAQRDGELVRWLAEGSSDEENELSKMLNSLSHDIPNSELMEKIKHIFVGETLTIQKPHFSSYIEIQKVRCVVNGNVICLSLKYVDSLESS